MKIVLMGNNLAGVHVLDFLLKKKIHEIMVITPFNKKIHDWHESLYDYAEKRKIKLLYNPRDVNNFKPLIKFKPDVLLSVYYDQILNKKLLHLPRRGAFNLHPSLLPKYRGVAPLIWALVKGEKYAGITIHEMTDRIDCGGVALQSRIKINKSDTGYTLHLKTAREVKKTFPKFYEMLINGNIKYSYPVHEKKVYKKSDANLNNVSFENQSSKEINNIVRALAKPLPGAYFYFDNCKFRIWKTRIIKKVKISKFKKYKDFYFSDKIIIVKCKNNTYLSLDGMENKKILLKKLKNK